MIKKPSKQFIALYTNIKGEEIEKIFTKQPAAKTFKEIGKFRKDVDQLSIRERMKQRAEYMEGTKKKNSVNAKALTTSVKIKKHFAKFIQIIYAALKKTIKHIFHRAVAH